MGSFDMVATKPARPYFLRIEKNNFTFRVKIGNCPALQNTLSDYISLACQWRAHRVTPTASENEENVSV
jgi:hypothetical protein